VKSRIVLAIGGNSLIRSKDRSSFADQLGTAAETCRHIADLVAAGNEVVVTHGNGPQVGFLLIRSHLSRTRLPEIPLDACNADTQAEVGYMIQQSLANEFASRGMNYQESDEPQRHRGTEAEVRNLKPEIRHGPRCVVTVVTQVVVDQNDPAFKNPSKPVGPFYTKAEAAALQKELGWTMREDAGRGFRRMVASPRPVEVVELPAVERLVEQGMVVIACGGGGIPVVREWAKAEPRRQKAEGRRDGAEEARLRGVAAVIDKDLASSLLARLIGADTLVISTAVEQVCLDYGKPNQRPLADVRMTEMREYLRAGQFPEGSMGPKVEAALEFLEADEGRKQKSEGRSQNGGAEVTAGGRQRLVVITDPEHIGAAMRGEAGTRIRC